MLLEIHDLAKYFGGLAAISDFDMNVRKGEILGLIGPNGAGKSTLFNLITGVFRPTSGRVLFKGKDITGKSSHEIARLGIARSFQLNPLFGDFSVLENVSASFHLLASSNLLGTYFNTRSYRRKEAVIKEKSAEILRLVGLDGVKDELAKHLPHGHQKMLGVARALAVQPELLLLDEPIAGMNTEEIEFTLSAILKTREQGVTIVLVEHNMRIMELCDRVSVISFGRNVAEGTPLEIRDNKEVIKAYFGGEHVA